MGELCKVSHGGAIAAIIADQTERALWEVKNVIDCGSEYLDWKENFQKETMQSTVNRGVEGGKVK